MITAKGFYQCLYPTGAQGQEEILVQKEEEIHTMDK